MAKYAVIIEKTKGNYPAYCPDLPGSIATGRTIDETIQKMKDSLMLHIECLKEDNIATKEPSTQVAIIEVIV